MKKKTIMGLEYKYEVLVVYLVGILGLVFSLMKKNDIDKDVKFQYNQSATIFMISASLMVITTILRHSIKILLFTSYALSLIQLALLSCGDLD